MSRVKYVIRAGGVGSRLWPFSRASRPKQFHAMSSPRTMVQESMDRLLPLAPLDDIFVSVGRQMADLVGEQVPELLPDHLILEPALRNTGPAVGLECALLEARYPGCTIASLGSDHYIGRPEEYRRLLGAAAEAVDLHPEHLITVGVRPTRAETGYGYIHKGDALCEAGGEVVSQVLNFTEKPDKTRAQQYVESGEYLWNTNTFVWRAATMLELFARFEPDMWEILDRIGRAATDPGWEDVVASEYPGLRSVAIDNAIVELAPRVATLEGELDWGDVGSWAALTDVMSVDGDGNLLQGEILTIDARNVVAYGGADKLIALVGVEDLVVVDTEDALLVCRRDEAQRVREVLERLQSERRLQRYT